MIAHPYMLGDLAIAHPAPFSDLFSFGMEDEL